MQFAKENLPLIFLSVALILTFLYGRYQYFKGYLYACKDYNKNIITEDEKIHYGDYKYQYGYNAGFSDGLEKLSQILEKAEVEASGGWIDEATEWRKIAQEFIVNISKSKQNE
jgi:hypothetical protein